LTEFLEGTGRANGMAFDQNGYLIAAADMDGELWSIDENGNHTVIVDNFEENLLNGPNDLWIAPDGGIYFTDPRFVRNYWDPADPRRTASQQDGEGVYYLSPDRQTLTQVKLFPHGSWPNGIIGTPDGKILYLAVMRPVGQSFPGGRGRILAYDIESDGTLSNERIFVDRRRDPDGMTMDQWGNVYVAGGSIGIDAYSPAGERILHVPTGEGWTANVTFGGPNRKTLFITAGTKVFTLDMHVRGVK
jgi:gluconolactonase